MSYADSKLRIDCRLLLLVVFYHIKGSSAVDKCSPPDNALIGTTCFNFHKTKLSWSDAKIACETEEHLLARVESADHVQNIFVNMTSVDVNSDTWPAWIGARSFDVENVFVWIDDGAIVVEDVWKYREPSSRAGIQEDCAAVGLGMKLSSFDCGLLMPYLCMHDVPKTMTYFKDSKPLLCHCSDGNCNGAGDCPTTNKCARRWFGPGCQQRSLPNSLEGILPVLFDNDDSTCLATNINAMKMYFGHNHNFTWLRLVFGQTGQVNNFQLSFPDNGGKCLSLVNVVVNVNTVDLSCPTMTTAVNNLKVSWRGVKALCSCYVNGGKNMMLMFDFISTNAKNQQASSPIDGDKAKGVPCIDDTFGSVAPHYSVKFDFEFVPTEIILYRRINPKGYHHLDGVVISVYDEAGHTLPVSQMSTNSVFPTVWLNPLLDKPITRIDVTLSDESVALRKGDINICELEVFGECPNGTFGLLCEKKCIERCLTDACFDTGTCFHGERTRTTITTTRRLSTRKTSTQIILNTTSTFNPITNSTYQIYPRTTTHVYAKRTSATEDVQSSSTRSNTKTKIKRRRTTAFPKDTPKDYIDILRLSALFMGVSVMLLCSATGYLCRYWRVSDSKDDIYDDDKGDADQDSIFTSSKYTSTSNMEESQSQTATASAFTTNTTTSRQSSQIE